MAMWGHATSDLLTLLEVTDNTPASNTEANKGSASSMLHFKAYQLAASRSSKESSMRAVAPQMRVGP